MWLPELFKRFVFLDLDNNYLFFIYLSNNLKYLSMSDNGGISCAVGENFKSVHSNVTSNCSIENEVYMSSFWSSLSNLPGNVFTVVFIDKMGRNLVTCKVIFSSY